MTTSKPFSATGNQMIAEAFRQVNPDVMAAYPITPQTTIVEGYAKFVANGVVDTEFVTVESEHSAMSACVGASAAGARVATATASQGLALMWEELYIASGMRLPIVMANANRALSAPINIHGDHSDVMGARDSGWIMMFAETAQEAYDNSIIAFPIAEDKDVHLPFMTTLDGFTTSHAMQTCVKEDDETVKKFVGNYVGENGLLTSSEPVGHGLFANGSSYMKTRKVLRDVSRASLPIIEKYGKQWAEITGRPFDLVDCWGVEDADILVVVLGSAGGNVRHVARLLKDEGVNVGVIRPRVFRPFPDEMIVNTIKQVAEARKCSVVVLDRADTIGAHFAPLGSDVSSALFAAGVNVPFKNYVFGLGGLDFTEKLIRQIIEEAKELRDSNKGNGELKFIGYMDEKGEE
jgi:pyruvate ferredoxin oxidoreductase alpha subunit